MGYYPDCRYKMERQKAKRVDEGKEDEHRFIVDRFKDETFLDKIFSLYAIEREKDEQMNILMGKCDF